MPDDRKVFDIAKPVATPATRPVISSGPPAPDPMVKPATKVSVSVLDEPAAPAPEAPASQPGPASISVPVSEPVDEPAAPAPADQTPAVSQSSAQESVSEVKPETSDIEVNTPPDSTVETAIAMDSSGPSTITPSLPGAPVSDFSNVPKFGELQSKVDAHPLFSGAKEHRVKVRRTPRFVWPLAVLLVLVVVGYLAIDSGVVKGYSHLPFHVFKQKEPVAAAPIISSPVATQTGTTTATDQSQQPSSTSDSASGSSATTGTTAGQGYDDIINKFILAMRNKDKKTGDSLESTALAASTNKESKTTSFYQACQTAGDYCTGLFAASFINAAEKTTKDYKAQNGAAGKEETFTVKTAGTGSAASTNILTIAAVPNGSSWLIDYVNASGGTNFVSD